MTGTMEPLVDTLIEDARWEAFGLAELAEAAARAALGGAGLAADGFEISLLGCSDARIAVLNADFRGKPQPTNVLSWPSEERGAERDGGVPDRPLPGEPGMPEELGDIAIAWETCEREAAEQGKPLRDHVTHLLVHGTLHLLGYDHIRAGDAALMEGAEVRILAGMGLANPYD
jgi:probable rRNA maturation factor